MTRRVLHLASDLTMPIDAITQTLGIFGQKGSGKSSTSAVFVEQGVRAGGRFVIADPTGVWWGLMHDGLGPGLPGIVFGGEHADVPLEATAGHVVAEFVVQQEEYPVVVLDMKLLRKADRTKFMLGFLETLYHENREALHIVLDESWQFAPTQAREGGETIPLLGVVEDVVALGRTRGLGITMISQRFATLNANVREQIGTLVAHRLVGALDRKALKGWIEAQADPAREKEMIDLMAKLPDAHALVWSPAFLNYFGVVQMNAPQTFDSRATPKVGQRVKKPGKRAPVDLNTLREKMAATIEEAERNDPKKLRQRLFETETKLKAMQNHVATLPTLEQAVEWKREVRRLTAQLESRPAETVEVPVMTADQLLDATTLVNQGHELLKQLPIALQPTVDSLSAWTVKVADALAPVAAAIEKVAANPENAGHKTLRPPKPEVREPKGWSASVAAERRREVIADESLEVGGAVTAKVNGDLSGGEQKVLAVLAEYPEGRTHSELAFLTGYSAKASTVPVLLSKLRRAGLVEQGQPIRATAAGLAAVGGVRERPRGDALLQQWLQHPRMGEGERRVLLALIEHGELTHDELAERTGYSPTASTIAVILSRLRKLGLVEKGARRVAPEFLEAIR